MQDRRSSSGPLRRALGCAALLLALGGLFAMHGLGEHGTMADHDHVVMLTSHHHEAPSDASGPVARPATGGPETYLGMSGLCLAVLLLCVFSALASRRGRRVHGLLAVVRTDVAGLAPGRPPPRPDLLRLSIQRC